MTDRQEPWSDDWPELPDQETVQTGVIPWSFAGLSEVLDKRKWLSETPHDDWDRERRILSLVDTETGAITERVVLRVDNTLNQIAFFIYDRYGTESVTVAASHLWRYTEINQFLTEHEDRLKEEGLIRNEGDQVYIAEALLDVLATTCYEGVRADSSGDVGRTFHPERVIEKAKRRQFDGDG